MFTTLYIIFSDAQEQITLELVVVSGRNLNSSKLSCMSSLPARMRMIYSKMKELECSRPVYIESCACVVKDAVKCSFECLSVVHHTCRIHSVGVGHGEMIK